MLDKTEPNIETQLPNYKKESLCGSATQIIRLYGKKKRNKKRTTTEPYAVQTTVVGEGRV